MYYRGVVKGEGRMDIITNVKLCNFRPRENVRPTKIIFFFGIVAPPSVIIPPNVLSGTERYSGPILKYFDFR